MARRGSYSAGFKVKKIVINFDESGLADLLKSQGVEDTLEEVAKDLEKQFNSISGERVYNFFGIIANGPATPNFNTASSRAVGEGFSRWF